MTNSNGFIPIIPSEHSWRDIYQLMNSVVQPRPIAWISTVSPEGCHNIAPFSYFNICSMNPPMISNSIFYNRDGSKKDTLNNIEATGKYVIGTISFSSVEKANLSSAPLSFDQDEFEKAQIPFIDRGAGNPRFVADCLVNMVCELNQVVSLGEGPGVGNLVIGYVRNIVLSSKLGEIEWKKGLPPNLLDNVGRMGGGFYSKTRDVFELKRPEVPK